MDGSEYPTWKIRSIVSNNSEINSPRMEQIGNQHFESVNGKTGNNLPHQGKL